MKSLQSAKRPPAELIIKRPDDTEVRFVRPMHIIDDESKHKPVQPPDEDHRVVMECAPYTASFNNLLEEVRPNENPAVFAPLVYQRMCEESVPLNTKTYNLLMRRVVSLTNGLIFEFYDKLKEEGTKECCSVRPDIETYRLLFRACERSAQYHRAFLLYQQMRDLFNLVPETSTYNTLLGFCAAVNDVAQATYFIEEMKENGVVLDSNTYNCFMNALVENAPYRETLRVFNEMADDRVDATNRTYNTMMRTARVHDDYDRAFQLFGEMKKKGLIPDIVTYNTLLKMCEGRLDYVLGRGKYAGSIRTTEQKVHGMSAVSELALILLVEMESLKIVPNTYSYNCILSVLLQCKDIRVFDMYKKVVLAYENSTGQASRKIKDPENNAGLTDAEAHTIIEEAMRSENPDEEVCIRALGVLPNIETYKLIITACYEFNQMDQCKGLLSAMRKRGVRMDRDLALVLLKVCDATQNKAWADDVLTEATESGLLVDEEFYNAYVSVLSTVADETLGRQFELMKLGINQYGSKANTQTYNIILRGFLQQGKLEECKGIFEDMRGPYSAIEPNDDTFCLVINLYEKLDDHEVPTTIIEECLQKKTKLNIRVFETFLTMLGNIRHNSIEQWFERIRKPSSDSYPSISAACYTILMGYYLSVNTYEKIVKLFNELKVCHTLEADAAAYKIMFQMYQNQGNCKAMISLFDDARMNTVKLNIDMYNIVLTTFVNKKDAFTWEVLKDMKANRMPPADSTMAIFLKTAGGRAMLTEVIASDLFFRDSAAQVI